MKRVACVLAAAIAVCGCQVKEIAEEVSSMNPSIKVFTATIEDKSPADTRTVLDGSGNVFWKQGDLVSVFKGDATNVKYQVTDESAGKTTAVLDRISSSGSINCTEIDNNIAFYPYEQTATVTRNGDSYIISDVTLPATQFYAEDSFGNGAFPMAAVTKSPEDTEFKFKNVLGGLILQLKGTTTVASITVKGNRGEALCGDAEVTVAYGTVPSLTLTDASARSVVLDCGAGVALDPETATQFVIALPPMTLEEGFTVEVRDTEGTIMEVPTTKSQTIIRSSLLRMPEVEYVGTRDYLNEPLTITSIGNTSVKIHGYTSYDAPILFYRVNSGEWKRYFMGDSIALSDGDAVQFDAQFHPNKTMALSIYSCCQFHTNGPGKIEASGNIMSLLDSSLQKDNVPHDAFAFLFSGCRELVNASNLKLPATNLSERCYYSMFGGCPNLKYAPELPATSLKPSCYFSMFSGCVSLEIAPKLPATTLDRKCYCRMFEYCEGLASGPELPATILADACYESMFDGCKGLTTAPELPATTLAAGCYARMFYECTELTTAPVLPATSLAGQCYVEMFRGCSKLNYIKMLGDKGLYNFERLDYWVEGVAKEGTFVKSSSATLPTGFNGIPEGWTVLSE